MFPRKSYQCPKEGWTASLAGSSDAMGGYDANDRRGGTFRYVSGSVGLTSQEIGDQTKSPLKQGLSVQFGLKCT